MALPNWYDPLGEASITSYNFTDAAMQTGDLVFYGYHDKSASGALTVNSSVYSATVATAQAYTGASYTLPIYSNIYDVQINKNHLLTGKAILNIPVQAAGGSDATYYMMASGAVICQVKNGVETFISQADSQETSFVRTGGVFTTNAGKMLLCRFDIPNTVFKSGNLLRLKLYVYGKTTGTFSVGHDPQNRTGPANYEWTAGDDTILRLIIPTKIFL